MQRKSLTRYFKANRETKRRAGREKVWMGKVIRVVLVDDHPPLRMGLRMLLDQAPDTKVVGETGSGEEALALIESHQPDVKDGTTNASQKS
jgi:PleD family two-component response regulator